jgi:hypothetical protein
MSRPESPNSNSDKTARSSFSSVRENDDGLAQTFTRSKPATTIVQFLIHGDELPSIFGSFGSGEQFLDRKFASRWVLFSEGDEGGMSMTGYISSPISYMVLCS